MKQNELSTIRIKKEVYEKKKEYCNIRGLKIYKWVMMVLEKELEK